MTFTQEEMISVMMDLIFTSNSKKKIKDLDLNLGSDLEFDL